MQSSDGTVSAQETAYQSPYSINFTCDAQSLTGDFDVFPRNDISQESFEPDFDSWYDTTSYSDGQLPWGPRPRIYPAPTIPNDCDPVVWQRERVLAVGLKYLGAHYQHHHVPDWNPAPYNWPQWNRVSLGYNSAGIDCSDFSSWNYNYGLGIKLITAVAQQASTTQIEAPNNTTIQAQIVAQVANSGPADYQTLVNNLEAGDLLYIRGNSASSPGQGITHVIMWVGSVGESSDGMPLILDSHDNSPPVKDSNGVVIPAGVHLRPFVEGRWYHRSFDHALRIIQ